VKLEAFAEAAESYRRVVELDPDNSAAHADLGVTLNRLGQFDGAVRHLRRSLELEPGNPHVRSNLAWILAIAEDTSLRDPAAAVEHARRALVDLPEEAGAHENLGVALYADGQLGEARDALSVRSTSTLTPAQQAVPACQRQRETWSRAAAVSRITPM
jgi:superkiller protein 3